MSDTKWRFDIEAMADPQSLPRILGYFAQRSIVPAEMSMRVVGEFMHIAIMTDDLPMAPAQIIGAKLAELFVVLDVKLKSAEACLHA